MRVTSTVVAMALAFFRMFFVLAACGIGCAFIIAAPLHLAFQVFPGSSNVWLAVLPRDLSSLPAILSSWWLHHDEGHLMRNLRAALVLLPIVALCFADVSSLCTLLRTTRFGSLRHGLRAVVRRALTIPIRATVLLVVAMGILTALLNWLAGPTVILTATQTVTVSGCMGFSGVVNALGGWLVAIALLTLRFRNPAWWFIAFTAICVLISLQDDVRGFAAVPIANANGGFTHHGGHLLGFAAGLLLGLLWNRIRPIALLPNRNGDFPMHCTAVGSFVPAGSVG